MPAGRMYISARSKTQGRFRGKHYNNLRANNTMYRLKSALKSNQGKKFCRKIEECIAEKKIFVTEATGIAIDDTASASIIKFSTVTQGDAQFTRDADSLTLSSLEITYRLYFPSGNFATVIPLQKIRIIIFQWFQNDATIVPTAALILQLTKASGATTAGNNVNASYNHDNRFNYRILKDYKTTLSTQSNASALFSENQIRIPKFFIKKFAKYKIIYGAGATTGMNNIYMLAVSEAPNAGAANTKANFDYYAKLNYRDS